MRYWKKLYFTTFLLFLLMLNVCIFLVFIQMSSRSRKMEFTRVENEAEYFRETMEEQLKAVIGRNGTNPEALKALVSLQRERLSKKQNYVLLAREEEQGIFTFYGEQPFDSASFLKELGEGGTEYWGTQSPSFVPALWTELPDSQRELMMVRGEENWYLFSREHITVGKEKFRLIYGTRLDEMVENQQQLKRIGAITSLFGSLVLSVLLYILLRTLNRPLEELSRAAGQIAEGDLKKRIRVRGRDEILELSENFNSMADAVEQKILHIEGESERKQEFIQNMAHEMRTPLTMIAGYAETLQYAALNEEERLEDLEKIRQAVRRLNLLQEKLQSLTLLKGEAFEQRSVDLVKLLDEIHEAEKTSLKEKRGAWRQELSVQTLWGDETLFYSLFDNLIHNGIRALRNDGTGILEVRCVEENGPEDGGFILVTVRDNGIGMEPEEAKRIFEPFYRVDKARSRADGGCGLGLTLTQRIVEVYGGEINVDSKPGAGTTITVQLPKKRSQRKGE